jgi:hypothetical protein
MIETRVRTIPPRTGFGDTAETMLLWARPTGAVLPCGSPEWEHGVTRTVDGVLRCEVWGDWLTEQEAVSALDDTDTGGPRCAWWLLRSAIEAD